MEYLFKIRKDLHRIPEIAHNEIKTCSYIYEYLSKYPQLKIITFDFPGLLIEYTPQPDKKNDGYLLFRAELDALPVEELTECDFRSEHRGMMHACGHDIHLTILIGLIDYVTEKRIGRNVLFLFQPAEEGQGGAEKVLATGVFNDYKVNEAYALHVRPNLPLGTISSCPGVIFGIPREFDVVFTGKSSHAANPHKGNDAIAAASHFIVNTQSMAAKSFPPDKNYLFHIGKINGGKIRNIVADECTVEGTLRVLKDMDELMNLISKSAELSARHYGVTEEVKFLGTYDAVVNSPRLYNKLKANLPTGIEHIEAVPALTGEDFGFFTSRYEGLLFWLGCGDSSYDLHSPYFLPDEKAILTGLEVFKSLLKG